MISRRGLALLLALLALGAAGALTLVGTDARAGAHQGPAARAVHALLEGTAEEARAAVPEDFAAVRGYHPVIIDDQLVRADGDCSSPVPMPQAFAPACQQHDYGYDLLRYADQTGQPLGRWARGGLDELFADRLHRICTARPAATSCARLAGLAVAGVEWNSLRQGDGVPQESWLTRTALASTAVAACGVGGVLYPRRRR